MKTTLLLALAFLSLGALAQASVDSTKTLIKEAEGMINSHNGNYRPNKAYEIFHKLALGGNAEAMNALGVLYGNGIGVAQNSKESAGWFNKSAKSGYPRAFYNVGLCYKSGIGVDVDPVKAVRFFQDGADRSDPFCVYAVGYMLYKGIGCQQSYEQSVRWFRRGAAMHNDGSYYMLGLAYRNGYGVQTNSDSARFYLEKAAQFKDKRALLELADTSPENANIKDIPSLQPPATSQTTPIDLRSGFQEVKHHMPEREIGGEYSGFLLKFDWSGKHIIGKSGLTVTLASNGSQIRGSWQEDGQDPIAITGTVTDSGIVFNNTNAAQLDHYHKTRPLPVSFMNGHFNIATSNDTVYLSGTPKLYSPLTREQQKPEFVMLARIGTITDLARSIRDTSVSDSLHFIAFPNPFTEKVQLRYTLKRAETVHLIISNLLDGSIVYRSAPANMTTGEHTSTIYLNGNPGTYIVTLQYGRAIKSAIILKR